MVASAATPFLRSLAVSADQVFAAQVAAGFLLELIFLQTREDDLGEVAIAVVLRGRNRDCVLEAAFLEVLGNLRRIELRLLPRLRERVDPFNRDTEGDHRHDDQDHADALGNRPHRSPHLN